MTPEQYIKIIQNQATNPTDIRPMTKVINREIKDTDLFQVQELGQTFIYKISNAQTSFNNLMLAQTLLKHGIPVPDSKIMVSNGVSFERYKRIPGISASLVMANNLLSHDEIKRILREALVLDKKISKIPLQDIKTQKQQLLFCNKRRSVHMKTYGKLITNLYYRINKKRTCSGNVALHQYDLNPSNILLDENNHVTALIDLDGMAICNEHAMLPQILHYWPNLSVPEIADIYNSVFHCNIDARHLKNIQRFRTVKKLMAKSLRKILHKNK